MVPPDQLEQFIRDQLLRASSARATRQRPTRRSAARGRRRRRRGQPPLRPLGPSAGPGAAGQRGAVQDRRGADRRRTARSTVTARSDDRPRLVLLSTSPRVAPGLLSCQAWSVLREGTRPGRAARAPRCCPISPTPTSPVEVVSRRDPARARRAPAWPRPPSWASSCGSSPTTATPTSASRCRPRVAARPRRRPSSRCCPAPTTCPVRALLDLVAVMDRLRSPGGCPWDAKQTHESLVTYLRRGDLRDDRGDRDRRPATPARGARRPAAAGGLPRPHRGGASRPAVVDRRRRRRHRRQAGAPSPARLRRRPRADAPSTSRPTGRSSRPPRRAGRQRSTACRWACRRSRSPPS